MNVRRIFLGLIVAVFCFTACNSKKQKVKVEAMVADTVVTAVVTEEKFPELEEGEVEVSEAIWGDIKELKGTNKATGEIIAVKEMQLLVKGSYVVVKNVSFGKMFSVFTLPDFKRVKYFGKMGRGPGEFQYPLLVPVEGNECLCYILEQANNTLFELKNDLTLTETTMHLDANKTKRSIGDKQVHCFTPGNFIYAESVRRGKAIFQCSNAGDSVKSEMLHNLSFSEKHKSWASYIGDFGANGEKKRAVFAYKYFKRLVFVDTECGKTRTVNFDLGEAKKGEPLKVMSPQNITHYWGMSAQKDHVYVLYSGRSPVNVQREWNKQNYYIFVEQYDWNGNPVAKYRLDNWGYFGVNETTGKLYLASPNHEEPFFEYNLPE